MNNYEEGFKALLERVTDLYVNGGLVQYGLSDEYALEIVSNTTGIAKEKLMELKQKRAASMVDRMSTTYTDLYGKEQVQTPNDKVVSIIK